jgi:hypothetical protein
MRRSSVRLATVSGAEERSGRAASPPQRARLTHFQQVRSLTPAASAASVSDHPSSTTRRTITALPFGPRAALACNFIRFLLRRLVGLAPPASKEVRMNNVVRNYS